MSALSKTILLLAAAASAWMYKPPKKTTHTLLAHAQNFRAKCSWRSASVYSWFWGQSPPADEYGRDFGEDAAGRSIQALLSRETSCRPIRLFFGNPVQHRVVLLFPSRPFFPPISVFCSLKTCYLNTHRHQSFFTFSNYFYGATTFKTPRVRKIFFFSPQLYTVLQFYTQGGKVFGIAPGGGGGTAFCGYNKTSSSATLRINYSRCFTPPGSANAT